VGDEQWDGMGWDGMEWGQDRTGQGKIEGSGRAAETTAKQSKAAQAGRLLQELSRVDTCCYRKA
jgi:hypothetical protein